MLPFRKAIHPEARERCVMGRGRTRAEDREEATGIGGRKDADISIHPRMNIAFEFDHDFRGFEFPVQFHALNGHSQIKLFAVIGHGMNIVKRVVTI